MGMSRRHASALLLSLALVAAAAVAEAKLSDAVVAAFRGKLVVTRGPVAEGPTDKETIAKLKAAQVQELVGRPTDEGQTWTFHYAAFLKKTGNVALKLQFVSGEQDRRFAAETAIPIPDVDSPVLTGELTIGETQGLSRGKVYVLKLVDDKGDVVAKTSALFR